MLQDPLSSRPEETRQRSEAPRRSVSAELAIIVPTYNERSNIVPLVTRLLAVTAGTSVEILVVDDDSPDGTADEVRALSRQHPQLRCHQRIGRRGLASAFVDGALATSAPYIAILDADMQHDEALLPAMLARLRHGDVDLVVGSRYLHSPEASGLDANRHKLSRLGTWLGHRVLRAQITDPMSGFFMLTREAFELSLRRLSAVGFKILVDIIASAPRPLRIVELPYHFRPRHSGESKLDGQVVQEFALLLADKLVGRWLPPRFLLFCAVGSIGVIVHLAVLVLTMRGLGVGFVPAHALATLVAMIGNYALNNELTYRDRKRRGWSWLSGLVTFALACILGSLANIGVAALIFEVGIAWPIASGVGIVLGSIVNYALTSLYTWRALPRP